jgi:ABC-2 type transport system ATP-binding protein
MQLFLRLAAGALPAELRALEIEPAAPGARQHLLRLSSYDDVERILSQCRAVGCAFEEIDVRKADLEDVFVQLMHTPEVVEGLA